jgi:hypothetical protein
MYLIFVLKLKFSFRNKNFTTFNFQNFKSDAYLIIKKHLCQRFYEINYLHSDIIKLIKHLIKHFIILMI